MGNKLPNENVAVAPGVAFESAHIVQKGDPRIDGPYLDDMRAAQEDEYRRQRNKEISQVRDEALEKKKDIPFDKFRAKSQQQHDNNRYYEEKSVEEAVKSHTKKTPKTVVEKAWEENVSTPPTDSKKAAVKKADRHTKSDVKGDTPKLKIQQKKAKDVTGIVGQPSNETKNTVALNPEDPEVTPDQRVVAAKKTAPKKAPAVTPKAKTTRTSKKLVADTTRPTDREQMSSDPEVGHKGEPK